MVAGQVKQRLRWFSISATDLLCFKVCQAWNDAFSIQESTWVWAAEILIGVWAVVGQWLGSVVSLKLVFQRNTACGERTLLRLLYFVGMKFNAKQQHLPTWDVAI